VPPHSSRRTRDVNFGCYLRAFQARRLFAP
jgi:hypothetical protein